MKVVQDILVPGGFARSFEAKKGQKIKVIDVEGKQVSDFMAFNKDDLKDRKSVV